MMIAYTKTHLVHMLAGEMKAGKGIKKELRRSSQNYRGKIKSGVNKYTNGE
jgi:hypothetical protein